jgi:hypothetical protein
MDRVTYGDLREGQVVQLDDRLSRVTLFETADHGWVAVAFDDGPVVERLKSQPIRSRA